MDTLESLGKRIATTEDLKSVVRTMKSLSAVNIRQYDQAVTALREYDRTIEMGFQVVLRGGRHASLQADKQDGRVVAVVFGSDHGLCGGFNREVTRFAIEDLRERHRLSSGDIHFLVVGARAASEVKAAGEALTRQFRMPGSVAGMTDTAQQILLEIDRCRQEDGAGRVLLFHNLRQEAARTSPRGLQLLPLHGRWLRHLTERPWPSRVLPAFTMDAASLFAALVRQHLFIALFRAGAESAASEHAMRLMAMQAAERNIEDHLGEMSADYRRRRQQTITEELLDIIGGFEVLSKPG